MAIWIGSCYEPFVATLAGEFTFFMPPAECFYVLRGIFKPFQLKRISHQSSIITMDTFCLNCCPYKPLFFANLNYPGLRCLTCVSTLGLKVQFCD